MEDPPLYGVAQFITTLPFKIAIVTGALGLEGTYADKIEVIFEKAL
jgi:hypothetical protein